jgi:hypothetical protein
MPPPNNYSEFAFGLSFVLIKIFYVFRVDNVLALICQNQMYRFCPFPLNNYPKYVTGYTTHALTINIVIHIICNGHFVNVGTTHSKLCKKKLIDNNYRLGSMYIYIYIYRERTIKTNELISHA